VNNCVCNFSERSMCTNLKQTVRYLTQYSADGFSIMSLILTLIGKNNVLATTYYQLDLRDDNYEHGLMNFETYNTISNVNASNN